MSPEKLVFLALGKDDDFSLQSFKKVRKSKGRESSVSDALRLGPGLNIYYFHECDKHILKHTAKKDSGSSLCKLGC